MRSWIVPFSLLFLFACGSQQIHNYSADTTSIDETHESNELESIITPYKIEMEETMNVIIGHCNSALEKYAPESPLGNFSADVMYQAGIEYAKKQEDIDSNLLENAFCLLNFGGLRSTVNQGDISIGNVYELMPFDNTLTLVQLSAFELSNLLNYLKKVNGQPIAGAEIDLSGDNVNISIGGEAFDKESDVLIITSDYLAGGGDKMNFFKNSKNMWNSGLLMRDIYIDYIKTVKELGEYAVEGRIKID